MIWLVTICTGILLTGQLRLIRRKVAASDLLSYLKMGFIGAAVHTFRPSSRVKRELEECSKRLSQDARHLDRHSGAYAIRTNLGLEHLLSLETNANESTAIKDS